MCSSRPVFLAVAGISKVQIAVCTDRLKMGPWKHNSQRCLRADGPSFSAEGFLNRYRNSWNAAYHAHKAMIEELSRRRGRPAAGVAPTVPVSELALPVPLSRFQWPMVRRFCILFSPGTENSLLAEFRVSKFQILVSVKCDWNRGFPEALAVFVARSLLGSGRRPPRLYQSSCAQGTHLVSASRHAMVHVLLCRPIMLDGEGPRAWQGPPCMPCCIQKALAFSCLS